MDIGKYIGKFLLKHKYCSLPGLGVFDLKKSNAVAGASSVTPPKYQVSFTPVGSIDDMFASFIAGFENVSISNASNNIKEYCIMVKEEIAKTGKFEIEHIGKLSMSGNKMVFHQFEDLDLGVEPAPITPIEIKPLNNKDENGNPKKEDYSYPPANATYRNSNTNWMKMLLPVLALAVLAVAGYFGYQYVKNNSSNSTVENPEVVMDTVQTTTTPQVSADTTLVTDSSATTATTPTNDTLATAAVTTPVSAAASTPTPVSNATMFQVALLSYDNEASATLKSNKLKSYGNNTSVVNKDGKFLVVATASQPMNDTLKLTDSLRRMFNPKGPVYLLK